MAHLYGWRGVGFARAALGRPAAARSFARDAAATANAFVILFDCAGACAAGRTVACV